MPMGFVVIVIWYLNEKSCSGKIRGFPYKERSIQVKQIDRPKSPVHLSMVSETKPSFAEDVWVGENPLEAVF